LAYASSCLRVGAVSPSSHCGRRGNLASRSLTDRRARSRAHRRSSPLTCTRVVMQCLALVAQWVSGRPAWSALTLFPGGPMTAREHIAPTVRHARPGFHFKLMKRLAASLLNPTCSFWPRVLVGSSLCKQRPLPGCVITCSIAGCRYLRLVGSKQPRLAPRGDQSSHSRAEPLRRFRLGAVRHLLQHPQWSAWTRVSDVDAKEQEGAQVPTLCIARGCRMARLSTNEQSTHAAS